MSMVREKNPKADVKRDYRRVMAVCVGFSFLFHLMIAVPFPAFEVRSAPIRPDQTLFQMEPLPETHQVRRPPPAERPAVPVETESEDVPEDVTIATTELDFEDVAVVLPPPGRAGNSSQQEEETVAFWSVEEKPVLLKRAIPVYPEVARKAGLEGTVLVSFTVDTRGQVVDAQVLRGPEIFREAALNAVRDFRFQAAMQNDRPVRVTMVMPIRFRLYR